MLPRKASAGGSRSRWSASGCRPAAARWSSRTSPVTAPPSSARVLGAGGPDRDCHRTARRAADGVCCSTCSTWRSAITPAPCSTASSRPRTCAGQLLLIAGAFGGSRWFLLRRTPQASVRDRRGDLDPRRPAVVPALPGHLGHLRGGHRHGRLHRREAAPKLLGGASASVLAGWASLSPQQRRLLVACGGGAGLAAVYNVPLAGALFTAEVLWAASPAGHAARAGLLDRHRHHLDYLPDRPPTGIPTTGSVADGLGAAGRAADRADLGGLIRLIGWVSHLRARDLRRCRPGPHVRPARGRRHPVPPAVRQRPGHGPRRLHRRSASLGLLLALFALKPLVTAMCLGSGASGGLFTPTLCTGAVLGGALGLAWSLAWPGSPRRLRHGSSRHDRRRDAGPALRSGPVLELTHSGFGLMVPMMAATVIATAVAFYSTATRSTPPACPPIRTGPALARPEWGRGQARTARTRVSTASRELPVTGRRALGPHHGEAAE